MISLRHYQEKAIEATLHWWGAADGAPLVVLPTGTGKSVVVAELCRRAYEWDPSVRVLVLTHVQELVGQDFAELIGLWPDAPAGVYSAGLGKRQIRQITFGSIQSVYAKAERFQKVDVVIIDEAHLIPHDGDGMYRKMLADLFVMNPHIKILGLTATPYRMDRGRLDAGEGAIFAGVCYEYGIRQAIDEGFLSPLITKATHARLNTSGVGTRGGEFIPGQLEKAVDIDELNAAIVREVVGIAEVADRKSWLFFCSGIRHATNICELVREMGHSCETIHAKTSKEDRKRIIAAFKAGEIRALASMNVLTTGFNAPAVDLIAMLRPTKSLGLYVQMVGRGTRLFAGKENCLVLDFARNIETHGPVDLADAEEKEKGVGEAPVKECPDCEAYIHAAARVCPHCGHEFPAPEPKVTRFAADAPILSQPATSEWVDVDDWEVSEHAVPGRIPTMEVRFQCGMVRHRQWICFEHDGYARQKAIGWWRRQGGKDPVPSTIAEAVERADELVRPGQISVRPKGRYTEIVGTRALPSVLSGGEVVGLSPNVYFEDDVSF